MVHVQTAHMMNIYQLADTTKLQNVSFLQIFAFQPHGGCTLLPHMYSFYCWCSIWKDDCKTQKNTIVFQTCTFASFWCQETPLPESWKAICTVVVEEVGEKRGFDWREKQVWLRKCNCNHALQVRQIGQSFLQVFSVSLQTSYKLLFWLYFFSVYWFSAVSTMHIVWKSSKMSHLNLQSWMRLLIWFSNTVDEFCLQNGAKLLLVSLKFGKLELAEKKCAKTDAISSVSKLPRLKTRFSTLFLSSVGKPSWALN